MRDAEIPTYLRVYYTPYDELKAKDRHELERLLRQVEDDARRAVRTYNWLEGILRKKFEGGGETA